MNLGYVIVYVADVPATVAFYEKAFGLTRQFLDESGSYGELETGQTVLAFANEDFTPTKGLFHLNRAGEKPGGGEIGFTTADVAGDFARALAAGATAVLEPIVKPWGQTVSYVQDLNGVLVEICSPMGA
jgi:lactoylglutathione lyase